MPSSKEYLSFVLDQLALLDGITYRTMMGEFILYFHGKIFGGIYDDRLLVKPTKSALSLLPTAERQLPYTGAKEMLLVEDVENREALAQLVTSISDDLPLPRSTKKA